MSTCPQVTNLCRRRGDTFPLVFAIKDAAGAVVAIAGFSFLLTVDPDADPDDASANLFQLTGTITDAPNGVVQFDPSAVDMDQTPDIYAYDVQMTDGVSDIRTVVAGNFEITQDITK